MQHRVRGAREAFPARLFAKFAARYEPVSHTSASFKLQPACHLPQLQYTPRLLHNISFCFYAIS